MPFPDKGQPIVWDETVQVWRNSETQALVPDAVERALEAYRNDGDTTALLALLV